MDNPISNSLSETEIQAEKRRRRLLNELDAVRDMSRAEPERLRILDERIVDGLLLGFAVGLDVTTCTAGPVFSRKSVVATFETEPYPDAQPLVRLWGAGPKLYLPAVAPIAELPVLPMELMFGLAGPFLGPGPYHLYVACLFQGQWNGRKYDLPYLVRQVHAALTLDPGVLNAPGDALNGECARLFALHRDEYELPLEHPLGHGTAIRPAEVKPSPSCRFVVEED
jgi:hypothetical protein